MLKVEAYVETGNEGPILTNKDGRLSKPILMCAYRDYRCKNFEVNDWHYFYCAAQDAPNKHHENKSIAYPWVGLGQRLLSEKPYSGCPFTKGAA